MTRIIGVRFRKSGKVYYFAPDNLPIKKDDHVIVETARGIEYGTVVLGPREVTDDKVIQPLKSVIRIATPEDDETSRENEAREKNAYKICLEKIAKHGLDMKLIDSEYTFDRNKLLFYFTADGRIDFRELVKDLASVFRTRIELRQIGVRDETKMLGGIAICGRPLCCHTYLSDFAPVSIKMAKEQNLSLNPSKISGVCGRLMCCLKNEEEAYEYLNKILPHIGTKVKTIDGYQGEVQSVSVLKQRVKVLLMHENDEREVREYHVSELQFEKKGHFANAPVAAALPDEELDENALRELEQLEKEDLEDTTVEKSSSQKSRTENKKKHYSKNNYQNETTYESQNFSDDDEHKKYRKKYYNNRSQNQSSRSSHYHSNSKNSYRSNKSYNKGYHKSGEHHSQGY
ncbi:stage 0 sporulation protein [bacterium D16-51]|nr:stage 0 sporulation protein [bacterium D16-59]RKI60379.1 stage 0 sporulation protein [bacterium D16-51]